MVKRELTISSIYDKVAEACYCLRDFCFKAGIEKKTCSEMELCLTEALNNVVKHAYKENPDKNIQIGYIIENDELEIKLVDQGIPRTVIKDPALVYDPKDINSLPEGGMGLFIIKNLMDSVEYYSENGNNTFIMKRNVKSRWN